MESEEGKVIFKCLGVKLLMRDHYGHLAVLKIYHIIYFRLRFGLANDLAINDY